MGKLEVVLMLLYKDIICYEHFLFSFIELTYDAVRSVLDTGGTSFFLRLISCTYSL